MKYNIRDIFSTRNNLVVKVDQSGSKVMILEKGKNRAQAMQGFRVSVSGETIVCGEYNSSEVDVLLKAVKYERYAHLTYKEAYFDIIKKLASIGFSQIDTDNNE